MLELDYVHKEAAHLFLQNLHSLLNRALQFVHFAVRREDNLARSEQYRADDRIPTRARAVSAPPAAPTTRASPDATIPLIYGQSLSRGGESACLLAGVITTSIDVSHKFHY
jgi:hypothetical protein